MYETALRCVATEITSQRVWTEVDYRAVNLKTTQCGKGASTASL
jgi:hypothetical protein